MVEYRAEAMDFLRRVGSMLPAAGTDVELVCRLWTVADEYDVTICEAMQRFDVAIFDVPGEIEITRGAEPVATSDSGEGVVYLCTWTLVRSEVHSTSVALLADQVTGRLDLEVRDADGGRRSIGFPLRSPSDLYENLARSFFTLHGVSVSEPTPE